MPLAAWRENSSRHVASLRRIRLLFFIAPVSSTITGRDYPQWTDLRKYVAELPVTLAGPARSPRWLAEAEDSTPVDDGAAVRCIRRRTHRTRSDGRGPNPGHQPARSAQGQKKRTRPVVRATLERGARSSQHQNHARGGSPALPHAPDGRERTVGSSARVQPDPSADGTGRARGRRLPAANELQTYRAALDRVDRTSRRSDRRPCHTVPAHRSTDRRQPARTHRATGAQTQTQVLSVAESPSRRGS